MRRPIGALTDDAAAAAFAVPAYALGVEFESDALVALVEISGGYPFFIQAYGKHGWDTAEGTPISVDDVELAQPSAYQDLVHSFFQPRYERATPAERRYLNAMADLGADPVASAEVARQLGHDKQGLASPQRDGLLSKGLIYAPERGQLSFTVPNMGDYLRHLTHRP